MQSDALYVDSLYVASLSTVLDLDVDSAVAIPGAVAPAPPSETVAYHHPFFSLVCELGLLLLETHVGVNWALDLHAPAERVTAWYYYEYTHDIRCANRRMAAAVRPLLTVSLALSFHLDLPVCECVRALMDTLCVCACLRLAHFSHVVCMQPKSWLLRAARRPVLRTKKPTPVGPSVYEAGQRELSDWLHQAALPAGPTLATADVWINELASVLAHAVHCTARLLEVRARRARHDRRHTGVGGAGDWRLMGWGPGGLE